MKTINYAPRRMLWIGTLTGCALLLALTAPQPCAQESSTAAIAKQDTEWDGVSLELTSVKRTEGDSILVQFKFTNAGSKSMKLVPAYEHDNISEMVYYVDPKNKKKYTVIKDSDNKPLCNSIQHCTLEAGASKAGWSKLPAPPADVTSITVYIPGAPPFEKVALAGQ